jgi:hypothetical protein
MGGKDSSAHLERLLVENFVLPFFKEFNESAGSLAVYRDNLFLASEKLEDHLQMLKWLGNKAKECRIRFGSGNILTKKIGTLRVRNFK